MGDSTVMGIVRDLYYARKMSAGLKLPAPTVALLIKRLRLAAAMGGGVTKTVSGTMVHITDALAKAALSVLASIEPIQDLHGYASPWPGGGGVNIFDITQITNGSTGGLNYTVSNGIISYSGEATSNGWKACYQFSLPQTGTYHFHMDVTGDGGSFLEGFTNKGADATIVCTDTNTVYRIALVDATSGQSYSGTIKNIQIETGSTYSGFSPYSNICPISGRAGLSVYRHGKNLLNAATNITGKYLNEYGEVKNGTDAQYTDLIPVTAGETYVWSLISNRAGGGNNRWNGYDSAGNWSQQIAFNSSGQGLGLPFALAAVIPNGISYVRLSYGINDTEVMFKKQNYDTLINNFYEAAGTGSGPIIKDHSTPVQSPYNSWWKVGVCFEVVPGDEYVFSHDVFQNGTYVSRNLLNIGFYERAEDVTDSSNCLSQLNGVHRFTVPNEAHYVVIEFDGSKPFTFSFVGVAKVDNDYQPYGYDEYPCDWLAQAGTVYGGTVDVVTGVLTVDRASISSYAGETLPGAWISDRDVYAPGTSPTTGAQVVYELATPLTYQLTAQEVQMLLGENYVWSSSGDTVSVTYYAEGNANPLQSLNILLGGNYSNPKTADDVSDREALEIILGGNK